jgi:hypothetical protein
LLFWSRVFDELGEYGSTILSIDAKKVTIRRKGEQARTLLI